MSGRRVVVIGRQDVGVSGQRVVVGEGKSNKDKSAVLADELFAGLGGKTTKIERING